MLQSSCLVPFRAGFKYTSTWKVSSRSFLICHPITIVSHLNNKHNKNNNCHQHQYHSGTTTINTMTSLSALEQSLATIEGLEPQSVWQHFCQLSQIPRPSKKEHRVKQWLQQFALQHGAQYSEDSVGNCKLTKLSPNGSSDVWVATQGHIDMVTEKNKDKTHDFDNDPITLQRIVKNSNEL